MALPPKNRRTVFPLQEAHRRLRDGRANCASCPGSKERLHLFRVLRRRRLLSFPASEISKARFTSARHRGFGVVCWRALHLVLGSRDEVLDCCRQTEARLGSEDA